MQASGLRLPNTWSTIRLRLLNMSWIGFALIGFFLVLQGVAVGVVAAWQVLRWTHTTATYRASNLYLNAFSHSDLSAVEPNTYEHFVYLDATGMKHGLISIRGDMLCGNGDTVAILYNPNQPHIAVRASSFRVRGALSVAMLILGALFLSAAFAKY